MFSSQPTHPNHHTRYYIMMTTIVIGGIFLLLLLNNNKESFSLTGSTVGIFKEGANLIGGSDSVTEKVEEFQEANDEFSRTSNKKTNEIGISLLFNQVPTIKKEAQVKTIDLRFNNRDTIVNVNNDRLELGNLEDVGLTIKEFSGELNFDAETFSLKGKAKSIDVNGISLAAREELEISLSDVEYKHLYVDDLHIKDVELPDGEGTINVAEKLTYSLEQDKLKIYDFVGMIDVNKDNTVAFKLEGVGSGVSISGVLLDLNLK